MTYEEKCKKWADKTGREIFREKSEYDDLPLKMAHGSSSHHPDQKGGFSTSDIVLWVKWMEHEWFRPYGRFNQTQIRQMIEVCSNDQQIESLMELLSAKAE